MIYAWDDPQPAKPLYPVCTLENWLTEKSFQLVRIDLLEKAIDNIGKTGE
jgi:hypothetical protein